MAPAPTANVFAGAKVPSPLPRKTLTFFPVRFALAVPTDAEASRQMRIDKRVMIMGTSVTALLAKRGFDSIDPGANRQSKSTSILSLGGSFLTTEKGEEQTQKQAENQTGNDRKIE